MVVQVETKQVSRAAVGAWHRLIQTAVQVGLERSEYKVNYTNGAMLSTKSHTTPIHASHSTICLEFWGGGMGGGWGGGEQKASGSRGRMLLK